MHKEQLKLLPIRALMFGLLATLIQGTVVSAMATAPDDRPNIILIFTDDHGYADLGAHGHDPDVRTPHIDQLAADGALFTRAYVTAPQCIPSRAGIVTGRHQNAFGLEDNLGGPLPLDEFTVGERLQAMGYVTGMVGKWHLELGFDQDTNVFFSREHLPDRHGFEDMFMGYMQRYYANYDLEGRSLPGDDYTIINDPHYRVDIQTRAALAFLKRRETDTRPFFLYLCWFAPHSPIEGPPQYMDRLTHVTEPIRREALASILAMDDGLKMIRDKLEAMGLTENTLIFFISDNGAPLIEGNYIGSLNIPLIGEKGMQTDGGQRVPFIMTWPGVIPSGEVFDEMVWSLDATATSLAVAKAPVDERIEGVDLMPWLTGERSGPVHESLYWRWRSQSAILTDDWKFIRLGDERRYLFPTHELGTELAAHNRIQDFPEVAGRLENQLLEKANSWATPGLPDVVVGADRRFYDMHVDGNLPFPPLEDGKTCAYIPWDGRRPQTRPDAPADVWQAGVRQRPPAAVGTGAPPANASRLQGWLVRQGLAEAQADGIFVASTLPHARTFLARPFKTPLPTPLTIEIEARAGKATALDLAWLPVGGSGEESFRRDAECRLTLEGGREWTTVKTRVGTAGAVAILRVYLEDMGQIPVEVGRIQITDANGDEQVYDFSR